MAKFTWIVSQVTQLLHYAALLKVDYLPRNTSENQKFIDLPLSAHSIRLILDNGAHSAHSQPILSNNRITLIEHMIHIEQ